MRRINTHSVLITVNFNYCLQCHFGADKSNICRIGQTVIIEKEGKKFLHVNKFKIMIKNCSVITLQAKKN